MIAATAVFGALLCVLSTGNGLSAPGTWKGVHYDIPCGEYLPTALENVSRVRDVTRLGCAVECIADLRCSSFEFEHQAGSCQLTRVTDPACSTNAVLQGKVFYQKTCPYGWWHFDNHCYYFVPDVELIWNDAKDACVKLGAHLVSLQSSEELEFVGSKMEASDSMAQSWWWWTSGMRDSNESSWQDSANWFWDDFSGSSMASYHPWVGKEPNNVRNKEDRVFLRYWNQTWGLGDHNVNASLRHICECEL